MTGAPDGRIEAEFIWEPKEHAAVVAHLWRERMRAPGWRLAAVLLGAWLVWTAGRALLQAAETGEWTNMLISMIPWILFGLIWVWIYAGGMGLLAARRAMKLDTRVDRLQRHVIDGEGIQVDTGSGAISLPWSGMSRIAETEDLFLWYWHAQAAHYTPKRALTDTQVIATRTLVRSHAADRAELRS